MTIITTKNVKKLWNKITLFLCDSNITTFMSLTSKNSCQMTMISNFIRKRFYTKSINVGFSIAIFNFFNQNNIFISVSEIESHFFPNFTNHQQTNLQYHILEEIHKVHFSEYHSIQILHITHYTQDIVYKC